LLDKKAEIYRCGKELFCSKGFKDTNIAEITKIAGMATGSFYNYYPSKEKLFMEIYNEENVKLKRQIMGTTDLTDNPVNVIQRILSLNLQGMNSNPILREWYNREVFGKIEKSFREENGIEKVDFLYSSFIEIVETWQTQGKMRNDIDSRMIMMIFAAIINVDTHKDEIGLEYFPELLNCMTELIMQSLTDCLE